MENGRHEQFFEFRNKYPKFIYLGYSIYESDKTLSFDFHFSIPGLVEFKPHWDMAKPNSYSIDLDDERLNELVFSLGMVELVSYWKITCSPEVYVACGYLSEAQSDWWKKLYQRGLGEFFYTNGIEATDNFMRIVSQGYQHNVPKENKIGGNNKKVLIPIGGGKDSAVTLELLKSHAERYCFIINPRKATLDTVTIASIPNENVIVANRTLDGNMLALNKQGFLNGHTPFSALVAFSSVVAAYIHGIEFVALSNESSANESTVLDSDVNHQYSKSVEFESDFIDYEARYISSGVKYFSLLRPLTEIGIAKIFSRLEKYHLIFRSCNVGSKKDIWCANCPKCLFVYIILSPFLSHDKIVNIFGKDMLDDLGLLSIFEKLIGLQPEKPFECVGSCDEVNAALQELIRQYESNHVLLPELIRFYKCLGSEKKHDISEMCDSYNENNHVPEQFAMAIKNELKSIRGEKV